MYFECGYNDEIFFKRFILKKSIIMSIDNVVFEESVLIDVCKLM